MSQTYGVIENKLFSIDQLLSIKRSNIKAQLCDSSTKTQHQLPKYMNRVKFGGTDIIHIKTFTKLRQHVTFVRRTKQLIIHNGSRL